MPGALTALTGPQRLQSLHILTFLAANRYWPLADVCPGCCINADSGTCRSPIVYRNIDCTHYCLNIFRGTIKDPRFEGDIVFSFAANYWVTILTLGLFGHSLHTHFSLYLLRCLFFLFITVSFSTHHHFSQHRHIRQHQHSFINSCGSVADLGPRSEAEGRTDRQKERERQSASAYQWRVGAECSPAAPRLPAALSTSPADAGPPRSRSCPSTTGNPVENTAHLLRKAGPAHTAPASPGPAFKQATLSPAVNVTTRETQGQQCHKRTGCSYIFTELKNINARKPCTLNWPWLPLITSKQSTLYECNNHRFVPWCQQWHVGNQWGL